MIKTNLEALQWASSFLDKYRIETSMNEAELMLMAIQNKKRMDLLLNLHQAIPSQQLSTLEEMVRRRAEHEPLQYIIGNQNFYGRDFIVNPSVLIPRPETELLIEIVLKQSEKYLGNDSQTVLDIGTGSGAIPITLALEKESWAVHSVDISEDAIQVAKLNAKSLAAKVQFYHGDLFEPILGMGHYFDILVSNPPYIPSKDIEGLMLEVKDYEPHLALDGGEDGLDFYRRLIEGGSQILKDKGLIALEIGIHQAEEIKNLLQKNQFTNIKVYDDYQNIPRIVTATRAHKN